MHRPLKKLSSSINAEASQRNGSVLEAAQHEISPRSLVCLKQRAHGSPSSSHCLINARHRPSRRILRLSSRQTRHSLLLYKTDKHDITRQMDITDHESIKIEDGDAAQHAEQLTTPKTEPASTTPKGSPEPATKVYSMIDDVTNAMISPGFSRHMLDDKGRREKLCQSIDVKHQQQEIIDRRMQDPPMPPRVQEVHIYRRMPRKLSLDPAARGMHISPQTAPLNSSFNTSMSGSPRRARGYSRPSPYEAARMEYHHHYMPPTVDRQAQHYVQRPYAMQSVEMQRTPSVLPGMNSLLRQPITPPTERGEEGLDTLSKAARLKVMKEEYLSACSASFDAMHGIMT